MYAHNIKNSDGCLGIFLGILFIFFIVAQFDCMPWNQKPKGHIYNPIPEPNTNAHYSSNINNSGQRIQKTLNNKQQQIKIETVYQTFEVSQWVDAGDWSHDNDELTVTIPIQRVVYYNNINNNKDLDYVEDHWDDFISDTGDEILYSPDIFQ